MSCQAPNGSWTRSLPTAGAVVPVQAELRECVKQVKKIWQKVFFLKKRAAKLCVHMGTFSIWSWALNKLIQFLKQQHQLNLQNSNTSFSKPKDLANSLW